MNFFSNLKLNKLRKKVEKLHKLRLQDETKENIQNEINAHYQLAEFYKKHLFDKKLPRAEVYVVECYRAVAALGEAKGQYLCGQKLLEQGKFWERWAHHPVYGANVHKKYAQNLFDEAHAYLQAADKNHYALAKRLLGMANIHGWGIPKDMNKGYKLVLDSIEAENAWDRATKIFEELKLSSPEFFASLQSYRRG